MQVNFSFRRRAEGVMFQQYSKVFQFAPLSIFRILVVFLTSLFLSLIKQEAQQSSDAVLARCNNWTLLQFVIPHCYKGVDVFRLV